MWCRKTVFMAVLSCCLISLSKQQDIINSLVDQVVSQGTNAVLSVRLSGTNFPDGTWRQNGVVLQNQVNNRYMYTQTHYRYLVIPNVQPSDSARYEYTVRNSVTSMLLTVASGGGVVNGVFTVWTLWTNPLCGNTCGTGPDLIRERTRSCTNPPPANGGSNCVGNTRETLVKSCALATCPGVINGGFTEWTQWTNPSCGRTCGTGSNLTRERTRSCTNPSPSNGGSNCAGNMRETLIKTCVFPSCSAVNGVWSTWGTWFNQGSCSQSCGSGNVPQIRTRLCNNPPPSNGGFQCPSVSTQTQTTQCFLQSCQGVVNGGFTEWTQWTNPSCGITCGSGPNLTRERIRSCTNPSPANGGSNCVGNTREISVKSCVLTSCSDGVIITSLINIAVSEGSLVILQLQLSNANLPNGIWTANGVVVVNNLNRQLYYSNDRRYLVIPTSVLSDSAVYRYTIGNSFSEMVLTVNPVGGVINGGFTEWTQWTNPSCGITCGSGPNLTRERIRSCTNPSPANGGSNCVGNTREVSVKSCVLNSCSGIINGGFTLWTQWTNPSCGITCGAGPNLTRERTRSCTNPSPANGGRNCAGNTRETLFKSCALATCPGIVNGGFTLWTQWTNPSCGITCGTGPNLTRVRTRSCTNPSPANGGSNCVGNTRETLFKSCALATCPAVINGGFTVWTQWTNPSCGITCGTGPSVTRDRTRSCTNPSPANGGSNCVGNTREISLKLCNLASCSDLCLDAQQYNGLGYVAHPTDCDRYIQCYYYPRARVHAVYRQCPFEKFWDQATFKCVDSWKVDCAPVRCKGDCELGYKMLGSCRAYWKCDNERASPKCCMPGFSFYDGKGCKPNLLCRDNCPFDCADKDFCDKRPEFDSEWKNYNVSVEAIGWTRNACPENSYYDMVDCSCSYIQPGCGYQSILNAANIGASIDLTDTRNIQTSSDRIVFQEDSYLFYNISYNRPTTLNPTVLQIKFRESTTSFGHRVLLTAPHCQTSKGNTLKVSLDGDQMYFEIMSTYGTIVKHAISTAGMPRTAEKVLFIAYTGYDLLVTIASGSLRYTSRVYASDSIISECGVILGTDNKMVSSFTNFIGHVEYFMTGDCWPVMHYNI